MLEHLGRDLYSRDHYFAKSVADFLNLRKELPENADYLILFKGVELRALGPYHYRMSDKTDEVILGPNELPNKLRIDDGLHEGVLIMHMKHRKGRPKDIVALLLAIKDSPREAVEVKEAEKSKESFFAHLNPLRPSWNGGY